MAYEIKFYEDSIYDIRIVVRENASESYLVHIKENNVLHDFTSEQFRNWILFNINIALKKITGAEGFVL